MRALEQDAMPARVVAVARVRWLQAMLRLPSQYNLFTAALFGSPRYNDSPQINDAGRPLPTANPWLLALWRTALELARVTDNDWIVDALLASITALWRDEELRSAFLQLDSERLRAPLDDGRAAPWYYARGRASRPRG